MTNTQLCLALGLPILVNLISATIVILYVGAKIDELEKTLTEKLLRVVLDTRLKQ
jgi:hypothetical protein